MPACPTPERFERFPCQTARRDRFEPSLYPCYAFSFCAHSRYRVPLVSTLVLSPRTLIRMLTLPAGPTESMRDATGDELGRAPIAFSFSFSFSFSLSFSVLSLSLSLPCLCLCFPFLFSFSFLFLLSFTAVLFTALPCCALISFGEPPHMKKAEHLGALGLRGETSWVHSAYLPPSANCHN